MNMPLTPSELRTLAPATRRLAKRDPSLVDTADFIKYLQDQGYAPVQAVQGTPHSDADTAYIGRHIVTCMRRDGQTITILNSHTICKRAWLGAGFWISGVPIIGAVIPLPRWKGYRAALVELDSYRNALDAAWDALDRTWAPNEQERRWLLKQMASCGFMKGHKTAVPKHLAAPGLGFASYHLQHALKTIIAGNIEAAQGSGLHKKLRRLKPIKGPDALFHAYNAAWDVGIRGLRKFKRGTFVFPKVGTLD